MQTSTSYFNIGEVARSEEDKIKEGTHYKNIPDGNGTLFKVINFENPEICLRQGIIELIPLKVTSRHENKVGFRIVTDKRTGIIYGIPTGINPETKKLEFFKIMLNDYEILDLSVPLDAMKWVVIKNSFFLEGSPNIKGKARYKVNDVEKEAHQFLNGRAQRRKAVEIAEGLSGELLIDIGRMLGVPIENNSAITLLAEVVKRAEADSKAFMMVWDSPTRRELTILKKAIAYGIVTHDPQIGYAYQGIPMGQYESLAVDYLKDYPQVCQAISVLSNKQEADTIKNMNFKSVEKPISDDRDSRIARLEAELAAKDSILQEISSEKIIQHATAQIDEEMAELLAEGKRLNIKGIHLTKDKEKMKQKIAEKKGATV